MSEIKSESITLVDIDSIIPNPKNANRHSIEQIKRLEKLITYQGFRNPLIVSNRTGFLIVGHGRLTAAQNLGIEKLPVIYQDFKDEAQEYAYLISDNEIARWAELDKHLVYTELKDLDLDDIELLGLEDFELPDVDVLDPQTDEDEVPELPPEPVTKRGDVWLLGKHRLMCGDSTMIDDVEKLMAGEKADMVFTDPPYGGMVMGKAGGKDSGFSRLVNKTEADLEFISNFDPDDLIQILEYINAPNSYVFTNLNILKKYMGDDSKILIWDKKHGMPSVGNYNSDIEFIVFNKKKGAYFNNSDSSLRYSRVIRMTKKDNDLHPTMKPIELIDNCVCISSKVNDIVIDLFGGSGSTMISCEKNSRKNISMELSEKYCDVIINRYQNYTGKKAALETTGELYDDLKANQDG